VTYSDSNSSDTFTIYLGDAADENIKNNLPGVSFGYEANEKVYIHLDDTGKEIGHSTGFNDRWHNIRVFMDNVYDRISVILDGKLVFESVPRSPMGYFSPAISLSVGPGNANEIEIDDVSVSAFYAQEENIKGNPSPYPRPYALGSRPLFTEDFEQLKEKNGMGNSGWRTKGEQAVERNQVEPGLKHLSIRPAETEQVMVVKTFNVPVDFPFDISDNNFEIRYNDSMFSDTAAYDVYTGHGGSGIAAGNFYSSSADIFSNSTPGISRTAEMFNTYYIYTFDGKLLAEYDHNGNCVRDYIYAGNRLIAEYKPQTNEYFYYMTDQINSTRIITNNSGNVVFSEAYGPYGDVQKTWPSTYDPKLKFSGKEREGYSDLDYFGARYFDHKNYRFNSVDPVINKIEALYNPQLWNLYAYCQNNPVTYLDPDGRQSILDKFKNITGKFTPDNMVPPIVWMEGYGENIQAYDKMVADAIKITAGAAILAAGIEMISGDEISGKTPHGEKRAKQAREGDTHRQAGDPNRVVREGREFYDTESGHTIHTKGNNAIVTNKKGEEVTRFKTSRRNIQKNIKSGKWKPINKE
jgi:RHS repeat-associated protein